MTWRRTLLLLSLVLAVLAVRFRAWNYLPAGVPLSGEWGDETSRRAATEIVRAAYAGTPIAAPPLPSEPPHRVFVTAFGRGWTDRAAAYEATTSASLEKAARELGESVRRAVAAGKTAPEWLVVDVVAGMQPLGNDPSQDKLEVLYETGVDGLMVEAGGKLAVVLPGDPITEGWFSPRTADPKRQGGSNWFTRGDEGMRAKETARTRLAQALGQRIEPSATKWTRFRTDSFLLASTGTDAPIPLFRGMPVGPVVPEPEAIREAAIAGGEWLVAQLDSSGKFQYTYVPNRDQDTPPGSYSYIRHTATAWMMVRLGRRFQRTDWEEAGIRALLWSAAQVVPAGPPHSGRAEKNVRRYLVDFKSEAKGGIGHNAVTAIALAEIKDRLDATNLEKLKGLGISLEMMLRCQSRTDADPCVGGDGGFYENEAQNLARPNSEGDPIYYVADGKPTTSKKDTLLYEPGEGLLAVVTMAAVFPEEKHWMESALVSARYQSDKFLNAKPAQWWQGKMLARSAFADRVHWQTMALDKLATITGDKQWAQVSVEMGEAVLSTGSPPNNWVVSGEFRPVGPAPWDYSGSFPLPGRIPRTTPTGSRAEALNASRRSALMLGRDPKPFESMLKRTAGFQLRNQFTAQSCYFCPRPEKALGAFRAGMSDNEIRIDFIQHVIAGQADTLEWYEKPVVQPGG